MTNDVALLGRVNAEAVAGIAVANLLASTYMNVDGLLSQLSAGDANAVKHAIEDLIDTMIDDASSIYDETTKHLSIQPSHALLGDDFDSADVFEIVELLGEHWKDDL